MKHPAFIFVLTKRRFLWFLLSLSKKTQCPRQFPDDCHSGIVPALYGQFIGTFYKSVLGNLFHRRVAGIEGIQVKSLPLSAKHTADDTLFYRNRKLTLDCRIACRGYA